MCGVLVLFRLAVVCVVLWGGDRILWLAVKSVEQGGGVGGERQKTEMIVFVGLAMSFGR